MKNLAGVFAVTVSVFLFAACGTAPAKKGEESNRPGNDRPGNAELNDKQPASVIAAPVAAGDEPIPDELVTDPVEGAFSIQMPGGWKNEAWLYRVYELTRSVATTVSPDGNTVIFIGDPKMPGYIIPDENFNEQSPLANLNPLSQVSPFVPAEQYFTNYVREKFGQLEEFRITAQGHNPVYRQLLEEDAKKKGLSFYITDVSIKFEYKANDEVVNGLVNGTTFVYDKVWIASVNGISSKGDPEQYNDMIVKIIRSHKPNEQWVQQQQYLNEQRMATLKRNHENNMAAINASNKRHQIRMNGIHAASDMHNKAWQNRQAVNDRSHERFLNMIRDENTVADNSGQTFQVDNSHQKYFVNKNDRTYIGTHSATSIDDLRKMGVDPSSYEEVTIIR